MFQTLVNIYMLMLRKRFRYRFRYRFQWNFSKIRGLLGDKQVTIKDIAKACGVGVSTVSRVLNDRPDVSDEVRRRVLDFVESCGYIPNNSARDLGKSRSDAIGVVVRGTGNLFFAEMLKTISSLIDACGHTMVLHFIDSDADEVKAGAILEREKKLRGLIFLGGRYDYTPSELTLIGVPYVCCTYTNHFGSLNEEDFASVSIDDYQAAYRAVSHLISLGHGRIAALVPSLDDRSVSELRYCGYCAALEDNGMEPDKALIAEAGGCFEMPVAYEAMKALLDRGTDFTAVFAASDTVAIGAMKAIEDRGLRIPEDISVIGIDGLVVSEYSNPTLTTLVQPAEEMGRRSVEMLMALLEGKKVPRHCLIETVLRPGASVRQL